VRTDPVYHQFVDRMVSSANCYKYNFEFKHTSLRRKRLYDTV
jgi:hypothetical protein